MRGTLNICVLILNCTLICIFFREGGAAGPKVMIDGFGEVEGYESDLAKVFKAIPYGGSVSGDNRWKAAGPPEKWAPEILNAKYDPPSCPQQCDCPASPQYQEEDCLFLNVYTPRKPAPSTGFPVLVFIHGGTFQFGTSSTYDGSYLASKSDIIVVTINYRVGALGFLVFYPKFHPKVEGNFGIQDQILALEWVQNHIGAFGGNKNKVTISGESAGAMSVGIHLTREHHDSPKLFHQAILESIPLGLNYQEGKVAKKRGNAFAADVGCLLHADVVKCMRGKPVEQILKTQLKFGRPNLWELIGERIKAPMVTWAPVLDGKMLKEQPLKLITEGKFEKVPTLLGTDGGEGIVFVYGLFRKPMKMAAYEKIVGVFFNSAAILRQYPADKGDNYDYRLLLSELLTDYLFYCPNVIAAKRISEDNPVYSYIFDQPLHYTYSHPDTHKECTKQACHGAELGYVLNVLQLLPTPEEQKLAVAVSKYWGEFVKNGDPNSQGAIKWPPNPQTQFPDQFADLKISAGDTKVVLDDRSSNCQVLDAYGYGTTTALLEALYEQSLG